MKKIILIVLLGLLITKLTANNTIVVFDFKATTGNEIDDAVMAEGIPESIIADLMKISDFKPVERKRLKEIMQEQALQMSGMVDDASAVKVGKLIGATYFLSGTGVFDRWDKVYRVYAKLGKIETGEVLSAIDMKGENPMKLGDQIVENLAANLNITINDIVKKQIETNETKEVESYRYRTYATKLLNEGKKEEAIKQAKKSLEYDPNNKAAEMILGYGSSGKALDDYIKTDIEVHNSSTVFAPPISTAFLFTEVELAGFGYLLGYGVCGGVLALIKDDSFSENNKTMNIAGTAISLSFLGLMEYSFHKDKTTTTDRTEALIKQKKASYQSGITSSNEGTVGIVMLSISGLFLGNMIGTFSSVENINAFRIGGAGIGLIAGIIFKTAYTYDTETYKKNHGITESIIPTCRFSPLIAVDKQNNQTYGLQWIYNF